MLLRLLLLLLLLLLVLISRWCLTSIRHPAAATTAGNSGQLLALLLLSIANYVAGLLLLNHQAPANWSCLNTTTLCLSCGPCHNTCVLMNAALLSCCCCCCYLLCSWSPVQQPTKHKAAQVCPQPHIVSQLGLLLLVVLLPLLFFLHLFLILLLLLPTTTGVTCRVGTFSSTERLWLPQCRARSCCCCCYCWWYAACLAYTWLGGVT